MAPSSPDSEIDDLPGLLLLNKTRASSLQPATEELTKALHDSTAQQPSILSQPSYQPPRSTMEQTPEHKEAMNKSSSVASDGDKADYAHGTRLFALTASLMLGMFLTALDNVRLSSHHGASAETDNTSDRPSSALRFPRLVTNSMT